MDPEIPLVVPEVNPQAIGQYKGRRIIANPNCSTIQMVVALKPLHDYGKIKRVVVSTYQAVSGSGQKAFDGLAMAGGLDSFKNVHRAQYYQLDEKGVTFIERAIRYGNKYQENKNSAQVSLFGETSEVQFPEPEIPFAEK